MYYTTAGHGPRSPRTQKAGGRCTVSFTPSRKALKQALLVTAGPKTSTPTEQAGVARPSVPCRPRSSLTGTIFGYADSQTAYGEGNVAGFRVPSYAHWETQVMLPLLLATVCTKQVSRRPLWYRASRPHSDLNAYAVDRQDGSLERYQRHGWGDVSLLKPNSTRPTQFDTLPKPRCPSAQKNSMQRVLRLQGAGFAIDLQC